MLKPRIAFMGTPDFAVESLKELIVNNYNVVLVITAPDKPAGRGLKMQAAPVKSFALQHSIPVLQPEKLKDEAFLNELKNYNIDLQIVVAFRMLPEVVWKMPPLGTFNLHASLLPQYRGAAPINWAVINGEKISGITTFFLKQEIDTGNVIFREEVAVLENDTAGDLHDKLMLKGGKLVVKTVEAICNNTVKLFDQAEFIGDNTILKHAPKIFKDDCRVDWRRNSEEIYNFVRGLSPYPTAWTTLQKVDSEETIILKLFEVKKISEKHNYFAGTIFSDGKTFLNISTTDGYIEVCDLQLAGKKRMKTADFLRGFPIENYDSVS